MKTRINRILCRSVLSRSGIPGATYSLNPYTGCSHACRYCYVTFMKRFSGHTKPWGSFVDIKINAHEILQRQLKRAEKGKVMLSSVTDPYQPLENMCGITRQCLEVLRFFQFPVNILTKSPLVKRDMDILSDLEEVAVGLTITTDNDQVRRIYEPGAPTVDERVEALKALHKAGIDTYVFIGPLLPMNPDILVKKIRPYVNEVLIDRMNYVDKTKWLHKKCGTEKWLEKGFTETVISRLSKGFEGEKVLICEH